MGAELKNMRVAGLVLAGGQSTRFGGGDKTLRPLAGRSMLSHVLARLAPQVGHMAISANGDPARFSAYGLPVLPDRRQAAGPLTGVSAGLEWATGQAGCDRLLTVAGDTPFFPHDLAVRLRDAVDGHRDRIAVAASDGRLHPTFALWPLSVAGALEKFLGEAKSFSVAAFLDLHEAAMVDFPLAPDGADPFFNVNTPQDLATAEAFALRSAP